MIIRVGVQINRSKKQDIKIEVDIFISKEKEPHTQNVKTTLSETVHKQAYIINIWTFYDLARWPYQTTANLQENYLALFHKEVESD